MLMKIFIEPVLLIEELSDSEILLASDPSGEDPWGDDIFDDSGS